MLERHGADASLPSELTGTVSEAPVVGAPTEVYARVARGAMACWFGTSGPLKAGYVYHAEAEPAAQGGKAEIIIHERDRTIDNPKGCEGLSASLSPRRARPPPWLVENMKLPEPLAKSMEADVRRWGAGSIGCAAGDKGEAGWEPQAPEGEALPTTAKSKATPKKNGDT